MQAFDEFAEVGLPFTFRFCGVTVMCKNPPVGSSEV